MNGHAERFILRRARFIVLATLLAATSALALEVPPAPTQWFTDRAGLIDAAAAEALNRKLAAFEQQSGAQFIIYIFPALEGESIEDFTIRCAERWKVGQKKYDNGLILFVFVAEKKVRVEVGYGLEGSITDAISSRVIREGIAPNFQKGDYAGGLNAAADMIIQRITKGELPVAPHRPGGAQGGAPGGIDAFALIIIILIFLFVILPMLRRGAGRGGCGGCMPIFFFPGGGGGITYGGGGFSGGGGGFGGFSGGGGSFGGGGATGGW